tara:strand:- start:159123 stop:159908 length:786 start_codon:yes stop_codon:yes gene_type:complete
MATGMWQTQAAFAIGIIGVFIGWRGSIAKMTGFFDLSGSVKYLLYGIVSGMLLASAADTLILSGIITGQVNIITASSYALLIAICESAFVLFLLGRPRNVALRASPPFGWTLGLGIGAMQSSVLAFRLFDEELNSSFSGFSMYSVSICLLISVTACTGHAVLSAYQGAMILEPRRLGPFFLTSILRAALLISLILSIYTPLILVAPLTAIVAAWAPSQERWLPSGLTPAARQAYRRTTRQSDRHRIASSSRTRGSMIGEEE